MARLLSEQGHTTKIITTNMFQKNDLPERYPYEVVENILKDKNKIKSIPNIYKIFKRFEEDTDIYHVFNPYYLPVAGIYAHNSETPVVGRLNAYSGFCTNPGQMDDECFQNCTLKKKVAHNSQSSIKNLIQLPQILYQHISDKPINYIDRLFALSPAIKEIYVANGVDEELVDVIPNFYDPKFSATRQSKTNSDSFGITFAGRLRVEKGPDTLLQALEMMDTCDVHVDILGDGPLLEELKDYSQANGIDDSVTFHGWVDNDDVPNYLSRSDVFVHAGRWPEPFSRTILEAMQCTSPPVVSDIGAPPWIVDSAGVVFERGNPNDLADTLSNIQKNTHQLEELKNNCPKRLSDFEPERVVSEIEEQYTKCVL
jgi:glycosyltransferase involved in cell wall biosynthesis